MEPVHDIFKRKCACHAVAEISLVKHGHFIPQLYELEKRVKSSLNLESKVTTGRYLNRCVEFGNKNRVLSILYIFGITNDIIRLIY